MQLVRGDSDTLSMAGITIKKTSSTFILNSSHTTNTYNTARSASLHYQVPVGKKLVVLAVQMINLNANAGYVEVGSSTAAVTIGAVPAGYTLLTNSGGDNNVGYVAGTAYSQNEWKLAGVEVAAGLYVTTRHAGSASLMVSLLCKLENV